jgi:hypothetical protein
MFYILQQDFCAPKILKKVAVKKQWLVNALGNRMNTHYLCLGLRRNPA